MTLDQTIYLILSLTLGILFIIIIFLSNKIKRNEMSRNQEKIGGTILLIICLICAFIGFYTFGDKTEGIIFSLIFIGFTIGPIAMILGKVNKG